MKRIALVLVLTVGTLAAGADEPPVYLGSRVRVFTGQGSLVGEVLAWEGDRLSLGIGGLPDPYVMRTESIQRLELSRGRKRPWLRGLLEGAALGGVVMAVAPVENPCPDGVSPGVDTGCETKAYNVQSGLVGGGAIGLLIGALTKVERWEAVPPGHFRVALSPVPGGAQAAVTFTH
jgi:hypothetical protein